MTNSILIAISAERKINNKYIPSSPRYDIYVVEVNNLKLHDPRNNILSARINIIEKIRGKIDISDLINKSNDHYFKTYWAQNFSDNDESDYLKLDGKKLIVYGIKRTNTKEPTFMDKRDR